MDGLRGQSEVAHNRNAYIDQPPCRLRDLPSAFDLYCGRATFLN